MGRLIATTFESLEVLRERYKVKMRRFGRWINGLCSYSCIDLELNESWSNRWWELEGYNLYIYIYIYDIHMSRGFCIHKSGSELYVRYQCMSFRVCDLGAGSLSSQEIQLQKVATKSGFIANHWAMKPWNGCLLFFNEGKPPSPQNLQWNSWQEIDDTIKTLEAAVFFSGFSPVEWLGNMSRQCVIFS